MSIVLRTDKLTKHFGRIKAVRDLDFQVESGQVFGILGPNGSGKTTTLAMLLGVVKKTSGSFDWFGEGDHHNLRKRIGAILEHPIFYPFLSAVENLRISAHIKDVKNPDYDGLLKLVNLYERKDDAFKTYSLGMKQRLAIATALVSDPDVLILDEPTNGLDPPGIAQIRGLIREIAKMDKTIILASHLLDEVQKVCSNFMVLKTGNKIYQGSVEDVLNQKQRIAVQADNPEQLISLLQNDRRIQSVEPENGVFMLEVHEDFAARDLNALLFENGIVASHLANVKSNLEETFLQILKDDDQ